MSKPRYKWWGYVKSILRDYPRLRKELDELKAPMQSKGEHCRGSGVGRPVEVSSLLVTLPNPAEQRELEAVEKALDEFAWLGEGANRHHLMMMVFFDKTHTLHGAAYVLGVSYRTARRWQSDAIMLTAKFLGLTEKLDPKSQNDVLK